MKKTKKLLIVSFIVIIGIFISAVSYAEKYDSDVVVSLRIDDPIMEVNGVKEEIDLGRGTKPIVMNGRTLVPIRSIIEAFDGKVEWEQSSSSVVLTMGSDVVRLVINSNTAYCNNKSQTIDVAPAIINDRTMLPIRFVAESFNLAIAWNNDTKTVFVIRNSFDDSEYNALESGLPDYCGNAYVQVNNNKPFFKNYEIINASFEFYGNLDETGRCDVAMASISKDTMPLEERQSISSVKPTGWSSVEYDFVDGDYLYNRCHLIAYMLTGENANEKNLITGTRYLNINGMLPFEKQVDDYIEKTANHVMYRVTPVFSGNNLLADGVLMEAYSVEDGGSGITFCVYCYNVQPGVNIDYLTGNSSPSSGSAELAQTRAASTVYRTPTGKRYHYDAECGGKNSYEITLDKALSQGLTPCQKCVE